jgi:single-strand DNA-binding protein
MYLNIAFVFGNLTRDPEVRAMPNGNNVASFSLATNRVWKDAKGAKQESVEYHNVVVFGKQADLVSSYLKKGSSVLVQGRMTTRSWDAPDGTKKYRTEIVCDRLQFGPRATGGSGFGQESGAQAPASAGVKNKAPAPQESAALDTIEYPEEDINPDDIPF